MSYNVVQKIRNNYYLYEVTSEWDPSAKRSRQKRRYVGKCDENGNLVSSEKINVVAKDLGEYYLLFKLFESTGMWNSLCEVYGADIAKVLVSYSIVRCTRCCPPTQSAYAVRNSTAPDYFDIPLDSRLLTLEGYLQLLQSVYKQRNHLFRSLRKDSRAMVFNSNILCEPFHFYKLYGSKSMFNFNDYPPRCHFSAINMCDGRPFYFFLAKNNRIDRASLNDVCEDLKSLGTDEVVFNLRIKGCEEMDIPRYMGSGFETVLDLDPDSPVASGIIYEHPDISEYDTMYLDGSLYRYLKFSRCFFVTDCDVFIIQDTQAYEDQTHTFYRLLDEYENTIRRMKWSDDMENRIIDQFGSGDLLNLFILSKGPGGTVEVARNREAVIRRELLFGKYVIITNSSTGLKDIIRSTSYSSRYDQDLSIFRTDLQGGAALFPSNEAAYASLMGDFLSHYMKICLMDMLNSCELGKEMNYLDVFSAVSPIKGYWIDGRYGVSSITSDQEKVFRALGMEPPNSDSRNQPYK